MEQKSLPTGYTRVYEGQNGGYVEVHEQHNKQELRDNMAVAQWLADLGEHVRLLPATEERSPDATRNGIPWEFKRIAHATNFARAVQRELRRAKRQAPNILLYILQSYSFDDLTVGLYKAVRDDEKAQIQRVAVLDNQSLRHSNRKLIQAKNFDSLKK